MPYPPLPRLLPPVTRPPTCPTHSYGSAQGFWDFLQDRRRVSGTIGASRAEQRPLSHLQLAHFTWNPTKVNRIEHGFESLQSVFYGASRLNLHSTERKACEVELGALLAEQNDEWLVAGHRYMSETSLRKLLSPVNRPSDEIQLYFHQHVCPDGHEAFQGAEDETPVHREVKTA